MSTGELEKFLGERNLWAGASETIKAMGLKTLDDLRFMFMNEVEAGKAGLLEQWACLDERSSGVSAAALPLMNTIGIHKKAPKFMPLDLPVIKRRKKFGAAQTPSWGLWGLVAILVLEAPLFLRWRRP